MTVDVDELTAIWYDGVHAAVTYSTLEEQICDCENQYTQHHNHIQWNAIQPCRLSNHARTVIDTSIRQAINVTCDVI
jgi:hypothetical protein